MRPGLLRLLLSGALLMGCDLSERRSHPQEAKNFKPEADSVHSSWYQFRREGLDTLRSLRWALVLHQPTRSLIDSFLKEGVRVEAIYAPEHGLWGEVAAGSSVRDTSYQGVPVYSLYGLRRAPSSDDLKRVDAILFALRDVGVRYYTYLSTLSLILQAAARARKPVWVLDFPNPHAHYAYGPLLDSSLFSFVGLHATPLVLGLTIGEYARLLVGEGWVPPCSLYVVLWQGWQRNQNLKNWAAEARLFWKEPPSPALRSPEAIHLYPILGWYDASPHISVGRGLDSAFTLIGWDPSHELPFLPFRDTLLYGYTLRSTRFMPLTGARRNRPCAGWRIFPPETVTPDSLFRLGFTLLRAAHAVAPESERENPWDAQSFDRLAGTPLIRRYVARGLSVEQLYQDHRAPASWETLRQKYLLYSSE